LGGGVVWVGGVLWGLGFLWWGGGGGGGGGFGRPPFYIICEPFTFFPNRWIRASQPTSYVSHSWLDPCLVPVFGLGVPAPPPRGEIIYQTVSPPTPLVFSFLLVSMAALPRFCGVTGTKIFFPVAYRYSVPHLFALFLR